MYRAVTNNTLFRISFYNNEVVYELYVRKIYESDMFGFVVLEDFVFGETSAIVIDPVEERLKLEFSSVKRTLVPVQSVLRIDEVEKEGTAKIFDKSSDGNKVTMFPGVTNRTDL